MITKDNYKGFSLFNDIEDITLRTRNRAVVLANLTEDNVKEQRITPKGAALILGYFSQVPEEERSVVKKQYVEDLVSRGFQLA